MYGGFHAKFQVSRTNNKKRTQLFHPKLRLAVYATVWGGDQGETQSCWWLELIINKLQCGVEWLVG